MTTLIDTEKLKAYARADLQARIVAAKKACDEAAARGDKAAADAHWRLHIGLLEVQMGRTSSAEKLTMTPAVPAER